ncbi:hypothetical protein Barb4_01068 [Bacteroidales bacterium Barb4]|nr:hypothetical protein Barb4_01068 [Bacteroidales bacterium Barb4]
MVRKSIRHFMPKAIRMLSVLVMLFTVTDYAAADYSFKYNGIVYEYLVMKKTARVLGYDMGMGTGYYAEDLIIPAEAVLTIYGGSWGGEDQYIKLPVESIGFNAFAGSKYLKHLTIQGNTAIGFSAFNACENLESINLPDSLERIGHEAFRHCWKVKELTVPKGLKEWSYAFAYMSIESVTVQDGLEQIADHAFSYCTSLKNISLPESVKEIGSGAFLDCTSLERFEIPKYVSKLGTGIFSGCSSLRHLYYPAAVPVFRMDVLPNENSKVHVTYDTYNRADDKNKKYLVPDIYPVEFVYNKKNLTAVVYGADSLLPVVELHLMPTVSYKYEDYTIEVIASGALRGVRGLQKVVIPDGIERIGEQAFENCLDLTSANIPGGARVGIGAFRGCVKLKSVTIEEGVTAIEAEAFKTCSSLDSVTIPGSMEYLAAGIFGGCTSLQSVTINGSVTSIGAEAFSSCHSLKSIIIPGGVTSIGAKAFSSCISLTSIAIPNSVKSISSRAFWDCRNLKDIYLKWSDPGVPVLQNDVFESVPWDCRVHVPIGAKEKYGWNSSNNGQDVTWRGFPVVYDYYAVVVGTNDLSMGDASRDNEDADFEYGAEVTLRANPANGYHFWKWTNENGDSLSAENPYRVIVKGDLDVRAHFAANSYRVSYQAAHGGTISRDGRARQDKGEFICLYKTEVKMEAIADTGFYFVKWTDANGNSLPAANPYAFVVKDSVTVRALFAVSGYRVSVFADDNGTIKSGDSVYAHNTKATVEASANTGYHFEWWTNEADSIISRENPYTFVVTGQRRIQAHFDRNRYKVEVSARENGRIKSGGGSYLYGDMATAEAVADSGYHFLKWTDSRSRMVSGNNPGSFAVMEDMTVEANFYPNSFLVDLSAENGKITAGRGVYQYNALVTVKAEGDKDYFFVMWTDARGDSVSGDNPYSFIVDKPTVLRAIYTKSFYEVEVKVTVTTGEHGRIKSGDGTFAYKSEVTAEAEPGEGYRFVKWTDMNGDSISSENPYRFTATGDRILWAYFALGENRVSLTAAEHGRVTFGAGSYTYGTWAEAVAEVDTGYRFVRWADSRGRTLSSDNPYRFVVKGDMDMCAYFTENSHYVSVTADYGAATSWTNRKIAYNEEATAEVEPIAGNGYHFLKWIDAQGDSLSTANPYTFVVKENMDLHARFAPYKYFVTVDETEGGHATGGGRYYEFGEQVLLTASADPGFHFTGWTAGDRLDVPASAERSFIFTITQTAFVHYKANFARGEVANESFAHADARAYYADGVLHLVNLEGYILSVSTIDGRQLLQFKADDAEYSVAALPAGVYILRAASGTGSHVTKFVVKK